MIFGKHFIYCHFHQTWILESNENMFLKDYKIMEDAFNIQHHKFLDKELISIFFLIFSHHGRYI